MTKLPPFIKYISCFLYVLKFVCAYYVERGHVYEETKRGDIVLNNINSRVQMTLKLEDTELGDNSCKQLRSDTRFTYFFHNPDKKNELSQKEKEDKPFVVIVHGLHRNAKQLFDIAVDSHPDWYILAPLFPEKIKTIDGCDSNNLYYNGNDYRLLISNPSISSKRNYSHTNIIRFDEILLNMICRVKSEVKLKCEKEHSISLIGYSAGAQFSHRFAYLHASKLKALAIGAPGTVTHLNNSLSYWKGTANLGEIFGKNDEIDELKNVRVLFYVGSEDTRSLDADTGITVEHASMIKSRITRVITRVNLIKELKYNWDTNDVGKSRELIVVDGVGHDSSGTLEHALKFIDRVMQDEKCNKKDFAESDVSEEDIKK